MNARAFKTGKQVTERLSFNLVDNALDYLLSAAEHATSGSPRNCKYALLHLAAGVELLVKARVEKEHWSLLFADVDKANQAALASGDFKSVDFETACDRLEHISAVTIDKTGLRRMGRLRRLRNQVQHFAIDVELEEVKSLLVHGANFFIDFLRTNLPDDMVAAENVLEAIHEQLREFEQFVQARLLAIKEELGGAPDVVECPRCWQETTIIGKGDPYCPFCGYTTSPQELVHHVGEGSLDEECLQCGERTLTFVLYSNEFGIDHCMSCGTRQTTCLGCRHRSIGVHDVCPECGWGAI